ncbi:hypothetical protein JTB14_024954 [Gonioctena quinquepunctata]|nr:hypothetical protein JTB14_024954 [Gonioctena quinquepunctata]
MQQPTVKEITKVMKGAQLGDITYIEPIVSKYTEIHWSKISYNKTGDTILHCSARLGHTNIIHYLLSNFIPNAVDCKNLDDKTALHEAAQFSQFECCKILLEYGANVNALKRADWTPIMLACTKIKTDNSRKIVDLLLENGSLVNYRNKDGWTCAHLISREGDETVFKLLLQHGLDVKVKSNNGRTALHVAALHGKLNIVETLLNLGCDVNETDNCGNTSLHEALLGNNIDIFKILITHGANIYARNNCDYSLIHLAACGCLDILKFVLKQFEFDINEINKLGLTPLHCAARKKQKEIYDFLVQYGASETSRDYYGRVPSDYL